MTSDRKSEIVNDIAGYFTGELKRIVSELPEQVKSSISEIRLRSGRPLSLTVGGENVFVSKQGNICHLLQHGLYTVSGDEVEAVFKSMCNYSAYAYSEQIRQGFLTVKNGCRVGIAASAVYEDGRISGLIHISSLNIRIAAEYIGCAKPIAHVLDKGLLIAGPPSSGKTTVLRDAIRLISNGLGTVRRRVAVIDPRGEIAATSDSVPQNDLGPLTDVLTGCTKKEGIEMAIRTLSPNVLAFDEIGNSYEANAVLKSFHSGADTVCTAHLGSIDELYKRSFVADILASGAISRVVFLPSVGAKPQIYEVVGDGSTLDLKTVERGVSLA